MAELSACVVGGDGFQCFGYRLIQRFSGSSLGRTQELLELGPGFLDGIQVRRIGRQLKQQCACLFDQFPYTIHLVDA